MERGITTFLSENLNLLPAVVRLSKAERIQHEQLLILSGQRHFFVGLHRAERAAISRLVISSCFSLSISALACRAVFFISRLAVDSDQSRSPCCSQKATKWRHARDTLPRATARPLQYLRCQGKLLEARYNAEQQTRLHFAADNQLIEQQEKLRMNEEKCRAVDFDGAKSHAHVLNTDDVSAGNIGSDDFDATARRF